MEKNQVLAFQNVAKIGHIGKKRPVVGNIDYVGYPSMQKVNVTDVRLSKIRNGKD